MKEESFNRKSHWENIYNNKNMNEVSWFQEVPATSLHYIESLNLPKNASIIDVGGGDSFLVDHLLNEGYTNISVLDISEKALEKAQKRLGDKAKNVNWIVSDASSFSPEENYDLWHDRAAFHFLTDEKEIESYLSTAYRHIKPNGYLILGTFSDNGPLKCSGIPIKQYSEKQLSDTLAPYFEPLQCERVDHTTPFDTVQNFVFCTFKSKKA